ncbi:Glycoside Hydrolase Family 47 protein [Rhizophagus diaphanus]|nr:Glycoside Hydrolase Family 47 protein [Rhizophagus diaphanus] [Rhizophagus sp. MUCL 43196]
MNFTKSCTNKIPSRLKNRILYAIILIISIGLLTYQLIVLDYHFELTNVFNDKQKVQNDTSQFPKIQYDFPLNETAEEKSIREQRRESVKNGFLHAWRGYTKYAWGYDELSPVSNSGRNKFNGWGATIVDALDTMWIMDLKDEFNVSREFVSKLNFTNSNDGTNVFETIIRYLGGLLSAFELSDDHIFLEKAKELGKALLYAFNNDTGLPYNNVHLNPEIRVQRPPYGGGLLAEVGTLCLEFTKLSQLTGDNEFFFIANNITKVISNANKTIPGLYPIKIDQATGNFINDAVSFGANGDSFYEYLLKEFILVGDALDKYRRMYIESVESMYKYLIKESPINDRPELLFLGELSINGYFIGKMGHLSCFVPGLLALGSKFLNRPKDLETAKRLAETCYFLNRMTSTGIGGEEVWFKVIEEKNTTNNETHKRLPDGIYRLSPGYSLLRPETIESLFILYRITGDKKYQDQGWDIWQSLEKWCKTPAGYSGLHDVNSIPPAKNNGMESFFLAETLKYLYLLFSPPDLISLDTYVFNTEAHPLLRMSENHDFFANFD